MAKKVKKMASDGEMSFESRGQGVKKKKKPLLAMSDTSRFKMGAPKFSPREREPNVINMSDGSARLAPLEWMSELSDMANE